MKSLIRLILPVIFGLTSPSLVLSQEGTGVGKDPLLSQMQGEWVGRGYRLFPQGQKKALLEAQVRSTLEASGKLVSRNRVIELPSNPITDPTEPKEYVRLYWVRLKKAGESSDAPRYYDLGYGSGDAVDRPSAEGVFSQNRLIVMQRVGGGYRVESRTDFISPDESIYSEKAWSGDELLAETEIHYSRVR